MASKGTKGLVGLLIGIGMLVALPLTSNAGMGYWSQSWCNPKVQWWGDYTDTDEFTRVYYYTAAYGVRSVDNEMMWWYQNHSYECGNLGPPVGDEYVEFIDGWKWRQQFSCGYLTHDYYQLDYPRAWSYAGGGCPFPY